MIFGVPDGVWIVSFGTVLFNAVVASIINIFSTRAGYKRGYNAARTADEAMALGRMMEASRERYYAGEALARVLEEKAGVESPRPLDPRDGAV